MKAYRDLVISNSYHWSASLQKDSYTFSQCPQCMDDNVEAIPVEDYEKYSLNIDREESMLNLAMRGLVIEITPSNNSPVII
jgi:hypothetical protein